MDTLTIPAAQTKPQLNILHLEDSPHDHQLVTEKLRRAGLLFNVVLAKTRPEFENALAGATFDLIISDFALPGYKGMAALALARKVQPDTPFIFVSGTIGEERAVDSLKAGAVDYVLKDRLERLTSAVERALREAQERNERAWSEQQIRLQSTAIEAAANGIVITDRQGTILSANRAFCVMSGFTQTEILGSNPRLFKSGEHDSAFYRNLWKTILVGQVWQHEMINRRKDGTLYTEDLTITPVRAGGGEITHFIAVKQDVTERKRSEAQIQNQARLLDLAHDAILVMDEEDRVTYWNHGAERLYGWKSPEATSRKTIDLLQYDKATADKARHALLTEGDWRGELRQTTKDGRNVVVASRWTLLRDEHGAAKSVLVINTDMTERKKLEHQLLRAQRMESIGTLASGIAHDLNNILAPIAIAAQVLRLHPTEEEATQMLNQIESSAKRGAEVVRQVLTFARGVEGERSLLQLRHLVKEVVKIMQETFPKSIDITYHVHSDLWPITGDSTQLHQVLLNLCVNARDAMPSGGSLALNAENIRMDEAGGLIEGVKKGPYIVVQIRDTGVGIPQEIQDKIFEPFFTTKELGKGTGLGLSTALGIVKSHGGRLNVYSEPGSGTVFKIYLPAAPQGEVQPGKIEPANLPAGRGELIMVVDDEPNILAVTRRLLTKHGYQIITALDGIEALDLFVANKDKIQLVITDMMMPRMQGVALIRAIRETHPNLKVIAASGLANAPSQSERAADLKSLGVEVFLEKPYTAERLLTILHNMFKPD